MTDTTPPVCTPAPWPTALGELLPHAAMLLRQYAGFMESDNRPLTANEARGLADALASAAQPNGEPVAFLWQHSETGRTRLVMPDQIVTTDATWHVVGPLFLAAAPKAAPAPAPAAQGDAPQPFTAAQRKRLYRNKPSNVAAGSTLADWHRTVQFIEATHRIAARAQAKEGGQT